MPTPRNVVDESRPGVYHCTTLLDNQAQTATRGQVLRNTRQPPTHVS
jgi:hypothetical protein